MNVTTLEQSKKLKELGAPQETHFFWNFNDAMPSQGWFLDDEHLAYSEEHTVSAYTLEELIEWIVGEKRNTFYLEYDDEWSVYETEPPKDYKWHARYYPNTPIGFYDVHGETPLEAVYNLAVALREKGES
jgi:hypothetical protein